jgi:hypothetical protein
MDRENFINAYDFVIRCIDREDLLVSNRLNWTLFVNVALIAFLYNLKNVSTDQGNYSTLFYVICGFGFVFTTLSYLGVWAAQKQTKYLKRYLERLAQRVSIPYLNIESLPLNLEFSRRKAIENKLLDGFIELTFPEESYAKKNVIEIMTGFPRPFGYEGYLIVREAGRGVPRLFIFTMALFWVAVAYLNHDNSNARISPVCAPKPSLVQYFAKDVISSNLNGCLLPRLRNTP